MFSNKLQELEKQLLNDNDEDDECDADDSIGLKIEKLVASLPEGGFLLLPEHAKKLAALADLYKELDYLVGAVSSPKKPFASIVGGSKKRGVNKRSDEVGNGERSGPNFRAGRRSTGHQDNLVHAKVIERTMEPVIFQKATKTLPTLSISVLHRPSLKRHWLSSRYRIPSPVNTTSTEKRKEIQQAKARSGEIKKNKR
ncbi:hypothetical protein TB2_013980 [Malus domestica]